MTEMILKTTVYKHHLQYGILSELIHGGQCFSQVIPEAVQVAHQEEHQLVLLTTRSLTNLEIGRFLFKSMPDKCAFNTLAYEDLDTEPPLLLTPKIRWYENTVTWYEMARWLREELTGMHFTLSPERETICTVWFESDPESEKPHLMEKVLRDLFGSYTCGPMSNVHWDGHLTHVSFGFWNSALIENARRIFSLPEGLRSAPIIYLGPQPTAEEWERLRIVYDKQPHELPQMEWEVSGEDMGHNI